MTTRNPICSKPSKHNTWLQGQWSYLYTAHHVLALFYASFRRISHHYPLIHGQHGAACAVLIARPPLNGSWNGKAGTDQGCCNSRIFLKRELKTHPMSKEKICKGCEFPHPGRARRCTINSPKRLLRHRVNQGSQSPA